MVADGKARSLVLLEGSSCQGCGGGLDGKLTSFSGKQIESDGVSVNQRPGTRTLYIKILLSGWFKPYAPDGSSQKHSKSRQADSHRV